MVNAEFSNTNKLVRFVFTRETFKNTVFFKMPTYTSLSIRLIDIQPNWASASFGSGNGTAVEHKSCYPKVMGSNPAGCWAVFLLLVLLSTMLPVSKIELEEY